MRILLVEDNKGDARLVEEALRGAGIEFELRVVDRLARALEALADPPDLVLLDLSLPDSHGLATLARLRAAVPQVPIVVFTGYEDEAVALEAMRSGAQDYLVKGEVDERRLGRSIRYAVERARAVVASRPDEGALLLDVQRQLDVLEAERNLLRRVVAKPAPAAGAVDVGATLVDRYRLERFLGEGRFGRVFLAWDGMLERRVVAKILKPAERPGRGARSFLKEARLAAAMEHPNVVRVYDFGYVGDAPFLLMEHAVGGSLARQVKESAPLPVPTAAGWTLEILAGLAYIHSKGVLHRDLKPANVLVAEGGALKIADFGLALTKDALAAPPEEVVASMGTPAYVSPEGVSGRPLGPASDVYSVGALLHQLLTGRTYIPLQGRSIHEIRQAILQEAPKPPEGVPRRLQAVVLTALRKDPAERFASAGAMAEALRAAIR